MTEIATLLVRQLARFPRSGPEDELTFEAGVNVISGRANTGKTRWLSMLDYVMGDSGQPEDAFGHDLAEKYDSITALLEIGAEPIQLERRWRERGVKSKVFVNGEPMDGDDFSRFMLEKLGIPQVRFPQGSPYAERRWPELSWRMLLRHIYRQQRFWGDFADKQPESEQHACLVQFLGIAPYLFSEQYGELVEIRKRIWKMEGAKDYRLQALDEIAKELVEARDMRVALTGDSLDAGIKRLVGEMEGLQGDRDRILTDLSTAALPSAEANAFERLAETWAELQTRREANLETMAKTKRRIDEVGEYRAAVAAELSRMERARGATRALSQLKVTHCPLCDRPLDQAESAEGVCPLCGRPSDEEGAETDQGIRRIDAEMARLREELTEADELLGKLSADHDERAALQRSIEESVQRVERELQPLRRAAATILPPEIAVIDMQSGRLQEKVQQLERVKALLAAQGQISAEIDELRHKEEDLKAQVAQISQRVDFEQAGDVLSDGMNTYLNALQAEGDVLWTQKQVRVKLNDRSFRVTVDRDHWSAKLGGTLVLYFFLSYHYALLGLTSRDGCHYPGLVILDLPATLDDGTTVTDEENFIVRPFVALTERLDAHEAQVIVAGTAFEGLEGAHRIELSRIWR